MMTTQQHHETELEESLSTTLDRDWISELPWNVMDNILVRLPIKESVKTSILSKTWRYKWLTLSQLRFDEYQVFDRRADPIMLTCKLVKIIDRVLSLHQGQVNKFGLRLPRPHYIDPWIHSLSKKGVTDIELYLEFQGYPVPVTEVAPSFFLCSQLNQLSLVGEWAFDPPLSFRGFSNLTDICFLNLTISNGGLDKLFCGCPLLEEFYIHSCVGFTNMRIVAPSLKCFRYGEINDENEEKCIDIRFENTPRLTEVRIFKSHLPVFNHTRTSNHMVRVFGHLSGINKLTIDYAFTKILITGAPYNHLDDLTLGLSFTDLCEISTALFLMGSSPNLCYLEINAYATASSVEVDPVPEFLKEQSNLGFSFNNLQFVEMRCREAGRSEMEFMKFILANSPALEEMTIEVTKSSDEEQIAFHNELLQVQRASGLAEIIFL